MITVTVPTGVNVADYVTNSMGQAPSQWHPKLLGEELQKLVPPHGTVRATVNFSTFPTEDGITVSADLDFTMPEDPSAGEVLEVAEQIRQANELLAWLAGVLPLAQAPQPAPVGGDGEGDGA